MVSLSRYVIMQVLLAAAFIVQSIVQILRLIDSWLVNRAYLMRKKGKIAPSTTKNNFSLSFLPFLVFHILIGPCFYTISETQRA